MQVQPTQLNDALLSVPYDSFLHFRLNLNATISDAVEQQTTIFCSSFASAERRSQYVLYIEIQLTTR